MKKGESAEVRIFEIIGDQEKRVTSARSGPSSVDCIFCGSDASQINVNPGRYRIEAENIARPGISSATFNVKDNEFWVWDVSDIDKPTSFHHYPDDSNGTMVMQGAYRITLFTIGSVDPYRDMGIVHQKNIQPVPAHLPKGHPEARN